MTAGEDSSRSSRRRAIIASLVVSGLMLVGKWVAYLLTGSAALLADAAETVVHAAATGFAAFSLWYASRPADHSHPYGHGRIAYLSVAFEGTLVLAAAVAVISTGVLGLLQGVRLENMRLGLVLTLGLAVVNLLLGIMLVRVGHRANALILVANGKHVLADVWTTAAAVVGLVLVMLTGIEWLDPLAALLIGVGILISAVRLLRKAVAGMMDRLDPALLGTIQEILDRAVRDDLVVGYHQLRFRLLDDALWIDVHLLIPGEVSLTQAHDRATAVEAALQARFSGRPVVVTSHLEPEDHEGAHPVGHEVLHDPLIAPD